MNDLVARKLKEDFHNWSGGFSPESTYQISVYIDYALPSDIGATEPKVRVALLDWLEDDSID